MDSYEDKNPTTLAIEEWLFTHTNSSIEEDVIVFFNGILNKSTHSIENFEDVYLLFAQFRLQQRLMCKEFSQIIANWCSENIVPKEE